MSSRCWTLSPSDVASLWEECPRCVYLEVARGFPRPRPVLSKLVAQIDAQMRACCEGRRTEAIAADVPAGVFERGERSVDSQVIDVLGLYPFSKDKLNALRLMKPHIADPRNNFKIISAFTFDGDKTQAKAILGN